MRTLRVVIVAGLLALAGCSSHPPTPGSPAGPVAPSPPASPAVPVVHIGQTWDAPPWRITATGLDCTEARCVLHLTYMNIGSQPAPFTGTAGGGDSPLDGATGFDAQGREYSGARALVGVSNPGTSGATTLAFDVAPGVRLVRVDLAGVSLQS